MAHSQSVSSMPPSMPHFWPRTWWINVTCALATLLTTTLFGSALVICFQERRSLDLDLVWRSYIRLSHADASLLSGLQFSVPLLVILLAHELGHYLQCRSWHVDASLPFFLPSPTLLGTFGAFIRITSPILSRNSLFDIGVAGPLAGFAVLLPFLMLGVSMSQVLAVMPTASLAFGTPLAVRLAEQWYFPNTPSDRIMLHPVAISAWAGLLATAINLLPVGQLDGGHLIYASFGPKVHRIASTVFVGILALLGFSYHAWWAWALVLFFVGRRHPLVYDDTALSPGRWKLMALVCIIFLLSFSVVPVRVG